MSTQDTVGPKSLDCDLAQQEPKSEVYKDKWNYTKLQPKPSSPTHRVTLRSDSSSTLSKDKLINLIWYELSSVTEECALVYQDVDIKVAHAVIEELERRKEDRTLKLGYNSLLKTFKLVLMPTRIHECHCAWLVNCTRAMERNGFLTPQEADSLRFYPSPRLESFRAPYASSRKEPDLCILPPGMVLPTLVVESGWSESRPVLHQDRDLWLTGGAGSVQVVLIIKWTKNAENQVKGDIEVFDLDPFGNIRSIQQEVIFPAPPAQIAAAQRIRITRGQLFGPALPAGQNPALIAHLDLDSLRVIADESVRLEGYVPAL